MTSSFEYRIRLHGLFFLILLFLLIVLFLWNNIISNSDNITYVVESKASNFVTEDHNLKSRNILPYFQYYSKKSPGGLT